jgi:hypothetical protein
VMPVARECAVVPQIDLVDLITARSKDTVDAVESGIEVIDLFEHGVRYDQIERFGGNRMMPSLRAYPERTVAPDYPAHLEVRRISTAGTFRLHSKRPFLSETLQGEGIGLEEVGDGIWNIVYYRTLLGKIDERTLRITGM